VRKESFGGFPKRSSHASSRDSNFLSSVPRQSGCKKLKGGDKHWRIRIGDYRIVYEIDDEAKIVDVTRIAHRREVYN
jgi:mRNA-degrading endonuclease RelE of RelBE toxin-antitoxin system